MTAIQINTADPSKPLPSGGASAVGGISLGQTPTESDSGTAPIPSIGDTYTFALTLDRTFTDTPASGGGNVQPQTFEHLGQNWELWQVIPFLGAGTSPNDVGDCRVQLRNRSIGRGAMQLADMPDKVVISAEDAQTADWTNLPWTFTRPAANKFANVANGSGARKRIDYEPEHTVAANPAAAGIAQGESFTITLHFE